MNSKQSALLEEIKAAGGQLGLRLVGGIMPKRKSKRLDMQK